jgi:hypothetical protein
MMRRGLSGSLTFALLVLALSSPARAGGDDPQAPSSPAGGEPGRARSVEITVGAEFLTPQALGTGTATMTSNNQTGTPYTYFGVTGSRAAAPAFRGRLGYNITSMLTVEGGVVASRGNVEGNVSSDAENVPPLTVSERMTQLFVDVSVLAHLRHMAFSAGSGVPFLEAGVGYLRQAHQDNAAINTGQILHFGGGVTYMFSRRSQSRLTGLGFRADARIYVPRKSYTFGSSQQVFGGLGGSLVVAF